MSDTDNKRLVRRFIEEVINTDRIDAAAEFIAADYVDHSDPRGQITGVAGARKQLFFIRATYPDLHLTVEDQIAEGDLVVTRITARGTHWGPWLGVRPTGKRIEISAINIDRVVGGCIVEHWGAANTLEALLAIGALPLSAEPPSDE
jgi:predicted ester cyclase